MTPITLTTGDLLADDVEALVNPVNTVGIMGAGLAAQFKAAYPAMFTDYRRACRAAEVTVGRMHMWDTGTPQPRYIINFPTKDHWRRPSRLEYIDDGLTDLVDVVHRHHIRSIAIPALGAGLGGLDWHQVEPKITAAFADLTDIEVHLYPPQNPSRRRRGTR